MSKPISKSIMAILGVHIILVIFGAVVLTGYSGKEGPVILGIRGEFFLFALTLIGVAIFHHHTLRVALVGLVSILAFKFAFVSSFHLIEHMHHEWNILVNLGGLLLGFALLARHFEESHVPDLLHKVLPTGWVGGFVLLLLVFLLSTFLDNIAAAMIGGAIALVIYNGKVDIGYLAALVAASNAGGAGSVVGDTTTTMMWIDGVAAVDVTHAFIAAVPTLAISGIIASVEQHRYQPLEKTTKEPPPIDWVKILVVGMILAGAIITNLMLDFPAVGVWVALLIGALFTKTDWGELRGALKGALFLLSLVLCASMMPVDQLPPASWHVSLGLGFVSAVFDNIPLTKLALDQGGYDWGVLAFAVGYGGSMVWFGSSAGVALSNIFPRTRSVGEWVKRGWHVTVAYIVGFFILLSLWGWHPHPPHRKDASASVVHEAAPQE